MALVQLFLFFPLFFPPGSLKYLSIRQCVCVYSIYSVRQVKSMVSLIDTFDAETVSHRRRQPRIHPQCLRYVKYCTAYYLLLTPCGPGAAYTRLGSDTPLHT